MVDAVAFREGVGKLLAKCSASSQSDAAGAAKLFDTYGIHFDAKQRDEVVARATSSSCRLTRLRDAEVTAVNAADGSILTWRSLSQD